MSEHVCACECVHARVCVSVLMHACAGSGDSGSWVSGRFAGRVVPLRWSWFQKPCLWLQLGCSGAGDGPQHHDPPELPTAMVLQSRRLPPAPFFEPLRSSATTWDPRKGHIELRSASFHLRLAEWLRILTARVIPVQVGVEVTLGLEMQGSQLLVNLETRWSLSSSHSQSSMTGP